MTAIAMCSLRHCPAVSPMIRHSRTSWPRSSKTASTACIVKNESLIYYLTLYNENYPMPGMPADSKEGILKGIYRFSLAERKLKHHVQLLGSGPLLNEALRAADYWKPTMFRRMCGA